MVNYLQGRSIMVGRHDGADLLRSWWLGSRAGKQSEKREGPDT